MSLKTISMSVLLLGCFLLQHSNAALAQNPDKPQPPVLQGATNGTIGPKGADANIVTGMVAPPLQITLNDRLRNSLSEFISRVKPMKEIGQTLEKANSRQSFHQIFQGEARANSLPLTSARQQPSIKQPLPEWKDFLVSPGLVAWRRDFAEACQKAKTTGKPVLLFQMMGQLDHEFC